MKLWYSTLSAHSHSKSNYYDDNDESQSTESCAWWNTSSVIHRILPHPHLQLRCGTQYTERAAWSIPGVLPWIFLHVLVCITARIKGQG